MDEAPHPRHHPRLYDAVLAPSEWLGLRRLRRSVVAEAAGRVLEIGAGTGRNLPLYRRAEFVIATDPDPAMLRRAQARAARASCPALLVVADAQALPFRDATFDTAVATLVFCTVPDPAAGFAETRRVLKPNSVFHLLEHVRARHPRLARLQDRLAPTWRRLAGGCHLNRDTLAAARQAGFTVKALRASLNGVLVRARLRR